MWIPRPLYEALPYLWVLAGVGLLAAPFLLDEFDWRGIALAGGVVCILVGCVFWMHRREFRARQVEYGKALED
jgi:hypothetical protein